MGIRKKESDYIGLKKEAESMYKSGMCAKDICTRLGIVGKTFRTWKDEGKWELKPDKSLANEMEAFLGLMIQVKPINNTLHKALVKKWINIRDILLEKQLMPSLKTNPKKPRLKKPT